MSEVHTKQQIHCWIGPLTEQWFLWELGENQDLETDLELSRNRPRAPPSQRQTWVRKQQQFSQSGTECWWFFWAEMQQCEASRLQRKGPRTNAGKLALKQRVSRVKLHIYWLDWWWWAGGSSFTDEGLWPEEWLSRGGNFHCRWVCCDKRGVALEGQVRDSADYDSCSGWDEVWKWSRARNESIWRCTWPIQFFFHHHTFFNGQSIH